MEPVETHQGTKMCFLALPSANCMTLGWLPLSAVRLVLPREGGLQGESRCYRRWAGITSPPRAPCPLGVTICSADAPPRTLGLPQSPSRDPEPAPRLRSLSLSPGLVAVAGREVPRGRELQARDVPGRGSGRQEPGIPGEAGVRRRSPLLGEAGLPSPPPIRLHPEAPREPESRDLAESRAFQGEPSGRGRV